MKYCLCVMVVCFAALSSFAAGKLGSTELPAGSPLKLEHLAFSNTGNMYLDGPALEAACPKHRPGPGGMDGDGNVWFGHGKIGIVSSIGGRCVDRKTGMIRPYFGDDYWTGFSDLDEGPGCMINPLSTHTGLGMPSTTFSVYGSPLQGIDNGFFLVSDGHKVKKIWMDPEKNDSWWFKTIIGHGKKGILPKKTGGVVNVKDFKVFINMLQVMSDGRIIIFVKGGFYEYKEEEKDGEKEATLTCLLGVDDYLAASTIPMQRPDRQDVPRLGVMGGDGTFYLGTYFGTGYGGSTPSIWRKLPGEKLKPYAWCIHNGLKDGNAMGSGAHCGHHFWAQMHNYAYIPDDILLITAHDEANLRRLRNGRISSLCPDGEWRELTDYLIPSAWFWGASSPGPDGAVTGENVSISKNITFIVTGIDYTKATVGPLLERPAQSWPKVKTEVQGNKKTAEVK